VPFNADTLAAIMHHHFFTPAPDVSVARHDVPPELVAVLNRVLAKDPDRRFATTREMRIAIEAVPLSEADRVAGEAMLRELAQGSSVPTVRTDALPPLADTMSVVAAHDAFMRSADRVRRIRRHLGTGGVLAVACIIALWGTLRPRHSAPSPAAAAPGTTIGTTAGTVPGQPRPAVPVGPAVVPPVLVGSSGSGAAPATAAPADSVTTAAAASTSAASITTPAATAPRDSAGLTGSPASPAAPDSALPTGKLRVRVLPSTAQILLDGRPVGQGAVFDLGVSSGSRRLHITAAGYADYDTTLVVVAGQTTQLNRITLKGADEP
jgi:hypothetical protein